MKMGDGGWRPAYNVQLASTCEEAQRAVIDGTPGIAVLALQDLLAEARSVAEATVDADMLKGFDVDKWLGRWLQAPMPALAGQAPAELLDMPSGQAVVMLVRDGLRLLLARDRVIEAWLREQVVPAAEALAADPSRGRSIEEVRAHLAKKRSTVTRR